MLLRHAKAAFIFLVVCCLSKGRLESLLEARLDEETKEAGPGAGDEAQAEDIACVAADGSNGTCVPPVACMREWVHSNLGNESLPKCNLAKGESGVCCSSQRNNFPMTENSPIEGQALLPTAEDTRFSGVAEKELTEAWLKAEETLEKRLAHEKKLVESQEVKLLSEDSPAYAHQKFMRTSGDKIADLVREGLVAAEAARYLMEKKQNGELQMSPVPSENSSAVGTPQTFQSSYCALSTLTLRYRTADGSCNNAARWDWGKSSTGFARILPPTYADGLSTPRQLAASRRELNSARKVSRIVVNTNEYYLSEAASLYVMQFGQFLDHDLTKTAQTSTATPYTSSVQCCSSDGNITVPSPHQACFPIAIPADDSFFVNYKQKCMEFVRSAFAPRQSTDPSWSTQLNVLTAWLDGSNIYGSDWNQAYTLRSYSYGKLKSTTGPPACREQLPRASSVSGDCTSGSFSNKVACFFAGDDRVNEQPGLALMHTVWVREHNRIANELRARNPLLAYNEERHFQEARRIVIAELQHITYNEWLPIVIGPRFMETYDLFPTRTGYSDVYNPDVNPSITSEFATAAFRFGHTLVPPSLGPVARFSSYFYESYRLRNIFNDLTSFTRPDVVENMYRGLGTIASQSFDTSVVEDLTNFLFKKNNAFGMDLIALNVQRGRDHGIPTYNQMRQACGLKKLGTWNDALYTNIDINAFYRLYYYGAYESVDDIDLFLGGISEVPVEGGTVGHTFACIIGDMFAKLKRGDRYYYELGSQAGAFSLGQLNEIKRSVSMARILCDNSDISEVQPLVFKLPNNVWNPRLPCSSERIPNLNLDLWTDLA